MPNMQASINFNKYLLKNTFQYKFHFLDTMCMISTMVSPMKNIVPLTQIQGKLAQEKTRLEYIVRIAN